jgi:plastocyanin
MAKAGTSGDAQSAPLGTVLPNPLRVIVTQGGNPLSGRTVTWAVTPSGGSANPASSVTGADGIASTNITLPPVGATATITASSAGATGSPISFTADATGAGTEVTVTVQNTFFAPDAFRVKAGGLVTFTWLPGAAGHTVTPVSPSGIPTSSNPPPPGTHDAPYTFDTVFPTVGTFGFFCSIHGAPNSGMHGTITVVP